MSMTHKEWPTTIDEAVGVVLAGLSDEAKRDIAFLPQAELFHLHFGLGLWIRNHLGLWQGNEELKRAIQESHEVTHPDDASGVLIEAVWQRLQQELPKVH